MSEKAKKIIAKEFLLLLSVIIIVFLSYVGVNSYNWFLRIKYNKVQRTIDLKLQFSDSLAFAYDIRTFKDKDYISRVYSTLSDIDDNTLKHMSEANFRKAILIDTN